MTINTAYRHGDYPVAVNGVFAVRVQDINLDKNQNTTPYFEMGNKGTVGAAQDSARYNGSIRWYPINNQMECLFAGYTTSGSTVNLSDLVNTGAGVPVKTLKTLQGNNKPTSLEYSCQADGEFSGTINFQGATQAAGSAISATTPTGVPCYKSKDVTVSVGGVTGARVSGISFRANLTANDLVEIGTADVVGSVQDAPTVTCDIDFYESDAMAGNTVLTLAAPGDIVVNVGSGAATYTLKSMVSGPNVKGERGTVNGWATRRYSYQIGAYDASYGLIIT
jgi:hypothetical protein